MNLTQETVVEGLDGLLREISFSDVSKESKTAFINGLRSRDYGRPKRELTGCRYLKEDLVRVLGDTLWV